MSTKTKEYTNGEVTILWKADLCIHSKNCVNNLPAVFDIKQRPWINAEGASTDEIIATVKKCPSGALTYRMNNEVEQVAPPTAEDESADTDMQVLENGPLMVEGNFEIKDTAGNVITTSNKVFLCRCGASKNKPFCDGAHKKIGFEG